MNIVVLTPEGAFNSSHVFDTHKAGGSALLVSFLGELAQGTPVLIAAMDEAQACLRRPAMEAIKDLGAVLIDNMQYRGAYALIGIKGGDKLAEGLLEAGQGEVQITAMRDNDAASTTTTTFTPPPPPCTDFSCPFRHTLKLRAWNMSGPDAATCCEVAPADTVSIMVRSAGWDSGNLAEFHIMGSKLSFEARRGMNVAVLRPDGSVVKSGDMRPQTFDTMGPGPSEKFTAFLDSLENGTVVLIAARDEASTGLSAGARAAIERCGAALIDGLQWRDSYALVGIKGGAALAEMLRRRSGGEAVALARLVVEPAVAPSQKPVCEARRSNPPVRGRIARDQLELDVGCRYELWEGRHAAECLRGSWTVVVGGSNTVLMAVQLANMLAPEAIMPVRDSATMGGFTVVDVIVRNGAVIYNRSQKLDNCSALPYHAVCKAAIARLLAAAPVYNSGKEGTRITLFEARFWDHADTALQTVTSDTRWGSAPIAVLLQVSSWYIYCAAMKLSWCPRENLMAEDLTHPRALALFRNDMAPVIAKLKTLCVQGGRAEKHGCIVATNSWQNPPPARLRFYNDYNNAILSGLEGKTSTTLRLVDLWTLGQAFPQEDILGHGSPVLNLWNWQVMLGGMCPAELAADGITAKFEGELCFGPQAKRVKVNMNPDRYDLAPETGSHCPEYWSSCPHRRGHHLRCEPWECANSVPCTLKAVKKKDLPEPNLTDACNDTVACSFGTAAPAAPCHRLWCAKSLEWAPVAVAVSLVLCLFMSLSLWRRLVLEDLRRRFTCASPEGAKKRAEACRKPGANAGVQMASVEAESKSAKLVKPEDAAVSPKLLRLRTSQKACNSGIVPTWLKFHRAQKPCTKAQGEVPLAEVSLAITDDHPAECAKAKEVGQAPLATVKDGGTVPTLLHTPVSPHRGKLEGSKLLSKGAAEAPAESAADVTHAVTGIPAIGTKTQSAKQAALATKEGVREAANPRGAVPTLLQTPVSPHGSKREGDELLSKRVAEAPAEPTADVTHAVSDVPAVVSKWQSAKQAALATKGGAREAALATKDGAREAALATQDGAHEAASPRGAGDRFPLGLARMLASLHVVVGHLYAKGGVVPSVYFFGWGFTWVPWFFMLSGFVLFTAHLRRPKDEGVFGYVMRRSVNIYPLYAVSLVLAFIVAKALDQTPSAIILIAQSWLLQGWVPLWTEKALQTHCWFLSAMVVYWFLMKPLSRCLKDLPLWKTIALMAVLFCLPWLVVLIPALADRHVSWYREHAAGSTVTWLDLAVVFLKFHPACYLHVFVLGMLLAKLRLLLDAKAAAAGSPRSWRLLLEFMAPAGYAGLLLIFLARPLQPWGHKLSARLSVLLPFQAAILFGLAGLPSLPQGRVASFASRLDFLENYSYAVYVFQFICYSVWPRQQHINLPLFLIFLLATAVFMVHTVQRPVQRWWGKHPRARWGVPWVLSLVLAGLELFVARPNLNTDLPAMVRHDDFMIDMRLPIKDSRSDGGRLMNPSIAISGGRVLVAARRHRLEIRQRNDDGACLMFGATGCTIIDQTWYSQILLGTATFDVEAWSRWPITGDAPFTAELAPWLALRTPEGWPWARLCVRESYIPENNTLIRHVVTGPEDPKLVALNDSTAGVVFNSFPPRGADGCWARDGLAPVSQMYLAEYTDGPAEAVGHRLDYGSQAEDEKNWIPFATSEAGELLLAYEPLPHEVVACPVPSTAACESRYRTRFRPLQRFKREHPGLVEWRGSGQAVLVSGAEQKTPNLPRRHYLALLHAVELKTRRYAHFAYRFEAEPPYSVLQLSAQLPLQTAHSDSSSEAFAFTSGLSVRNDTVVISYGAGDRDARALVLTLDRLDKFFACKG